MFPDPEHVALLQELSRKAAKKFPGCEFVRIEPKSDTREHILFFRCGDKVVHCAFTHTDVDRDREKRNGLLKAIEACIRSHLNQ